MMYRVTKYLAATLLILIGFSSCESVKVVADYDQTVDFTKYRTFEYYGWDENSEKILNDLDKRRIESSFADEFYKRGLGVVGKDGDLIIALHIVVEQKQQQTATTTGTGGYYGHGGYYGYGPGYGWGTGYSTTTVRTYNYAVGTLIVSVYDKAEERLIWEGSAHKEIESDPKKRDKNIPYVVGRIMKKYPVPPQEE
jgi:hypothetical protein